MIKKLLTGLLAILAISSTFASSQVDYLNVEGDVVYFSLAEEKSHALPSCATATENNDKYTVLLTSETGRALYSLLITAMASKQGVSVNSANDCNAVSGVERAQGVSIVPEVGESQGLITSLYLYKSDGVTKLGRVINTANDNVFYYLSEGQNTQLSKYTKEVFYNKTIYFTSTNCGGNPYLGDGNTAAFKTSYRNGYKFKSGSVRNQRTVKSRMSGNCSAYSNKKYLYDTTAIVDICGGQDCIIKDE